MQSKARRGGFKALFVEPYLQVRLGLVFVCLNIVFSLVILGVFSYFVFEMFTALTMHFKLDEATEIVTLQKFSTPLLICAILIVLFIIITLGVAAHYTHKIYGPLIAINRFLDNIIEKKPTTMIKLRESDQLKELAEKLNKIAANTGIVEIKK